MNKINILNKEYENKMKQFRVDDKLGLSDYECECYSNMFYVLNETVHNQFTFEQLYTIYNFYTDVLYGTKPNIDLFSKEAAFKGFYRLSKRYSLTKNLKEEERLHFCFVIFWASCIMAIDEKTQEPIWNMECFARGYKSIIEEYKFEERQFPDRFKIKSYSNPSNNDYGYNIENPIEVTSVSIQYQYLDGIETDDDKKIIYKRVGTFQAKSNIFVDKYEIYIKGLLKNKKVATLYITGEGSYNSITTPRGFKFIKND